MSAASFCYQPFTSERFCAFTYKNEKELPNAQKLLRCSKCHEVFYVDRQAQVDHWPTHRKVCCPILEDDRRIRKHFAYLLACVEVIRECTWNRNLIKGRLLLHALMELKKFYEILWADETRLDQEETSLCRAILVSICFVDADLLRRAFAVPSFANFLLSEDAFISSSMIDLRARIQDNFMSQQKTVEITDDAKISSMLPAPYVVLLVRIILSAATCNYHGEPVSPLAGAATRRLMLNWTSQFCLLGSPLEVKFPFNFGGAVKPESFGSVYLTALNMICQGRKDYAAFIQDDEIIPGLTPASFFTMIMGYPRFFNSLHEDQVTYVMKFLQEIADDGTASCKRISASDKIKLLNLWVGWRAPTPQMKSVAFDTIIGRTCTGLWELNKTIDDRLGRHLSLFKGIGKSVYDELDIDKVLDKSLVILIKTTLKGLLGEVMPEVKNCVCMLEEEYATAMQGADTDTFPEDLLIEIASYVLPKNFSISLG